jgi:ABC-type antimicrobial peptide transport system permease subunit
MQTPLEAGRDFTSQDVFGKERVVIVNETLARTMWPGKDPLGKFMRTGGVESRVIGVVADVRHVALEETSGLEFYLPLRQTGDFSTVRLVFRANGTAASVAPSIRASLKPVVKELSSDEIMILQDVVDNSVSSRRFMTVLLAGFATFALVLALLGIYGVISYTVNHRTQEIGLRMALGATAGQLQMRIIRETLTLAAAGMLIGTIASWMLSRTLGTLLFGISAADPLTFASMLVVLTIVAVVSGYLPARRASQIDPVSALRGE